MKLLKKLHFYLPIFLSACLLQIQLGYMNGLQFEVNLGLQPSFAETTCVNEDGATGAETICDTKSATVDGGGNSGKALYRGMYLTNLINWGVAFVLIGMIVGCMKNPIDDNKCGYSFATTIAAMVSLLASEIVNIAMYAKDVSDIKNEQYYRGQALNQYKDQCAEEYEAGVYDEETEDGEEPPESTVGDNTGGIEKKNGTVVNVCEQYAGIRKQKEAFESMLKGAKWKLRLTIASATLLATSSFIEFKKHFEMNAKLKLFAERARMVASAMTAATQEWIQETKIEAKTNHEAKKKLLFIPMCRKYTQDCVQALNQSGRILDRLIVKLNAPKAQKNTDKCQSVFSQIEQVIKLHEKCTKRPTEDITSLDAKIENLETQVDEIERGLGEDSEFAIEEELIAWEIEGIENIPEKDSLEDALLQDKDFMDVIKRAEKIRDQKRKLKGEIKTATAKVEILTTGDNLCINRSAGIYKEGQFHLSGSDIINEVFPEKVAGYLSHCEEDAVSVQQIIDSIDGSASYNILNNKSFYFSKIDQIESNFFKIISVSFGFLSRFFLPDNVQAKMQVKGHTNLSFYLFMGLSLVGSILVLAIKGARETFRKFYSTPQARGWMSLGVSTLVAGSATMTKYMIIDPIQANIDKLEDILDGYEVNEDKALEMSATSVDLSYANIPPEQFPPPINYMGDAAANGGCAARGQKGDGKGGCTTFAKTAASNFPFSSYGAAGSLAKQGAKMMHGMEDGTIDSADLNAANGIAAKRDEAEKRLKKLLSSSAARKAGINSKAIEKIKNNMVARLKSGVQDLLNKKGVDLAAAMGEGNSPAAKKAKEAKEKLSKRLKKKAIILPTKTDDPFDFNFKEEKSDLAFDSDDSMPEMGDDMVVKGQDIFKNPDGDIWKMLTSRYMKTAYPVFFDEDAILEPSAGDNE